MRLNHTLAAIAMALGLTVAAAASFSVPAMSQSSETVVCHTPMDSVAGLDTFTKERGAEAVAALWKVPDEPRYTVLYVWFPSSPNRVVLELYVDGCIIPNLLRPGATRVSVDINPQILDNFKAATIVYTTGPDLPKAETY